MRRYLSKSRFKLALECPAKLNYAGKPAYVDTKQTNEFLKALAEGGFQVGELAKVLYPGGVEITDDEQAAQITHTRELLARENVTIFEGTIQSGDWVARVDVIRKTGALIELIEVKSKSFDSREGTPEQQWRSRSGKIDSKILPYLQDVAFQTMVMRAAYPQCKVTPFLMMVDKAERATVDGLNQRFQIHTANDNGRDRTWATTVPGTTSASIGNPLVKAFNVDMFVEQILTMPLTYPSGEGKFEEMAALWAQQYAAGVRITSVIGPHCRECEFCSDHPDDTQRSGFHECWREAVDATTDDIARRRPVTSLYWPAKGQLRELFASGRYWLSGLKRDDLVLSTSADGLTRTQRQYMQVWGDGLDGQRFFFDRSRWRSAMRSFRYPLSFIDFEGARPALPFNRDKRPYDQVAFQFSHHVMEEDGSVRHASQFIDLTPGNDPSLPFLRALHAALTAPGLEQGTVFMWSPYENTMLNGLRDGLLEKQQTGTAPADAGELIAFIETLTTRGKGEQKVVGERAMVDLYKLADKLFFHPDTDGRSSIKVVLPAVMKSSTWLRRRYSQPIYGAPGGIPSLNFPLPGETGMTWWQADCDGAKNPYLLLPPIFVDMPREIEASLEGREDEAVREGGAAMTAYARMQFSDVPHEIRSATQVALLRYCELDTLAMVMVFEAWREWAKEVN